ncbi:unnamed protein product [Cuscuta epithymum]|uniref:Uncharacterized protein n=1 Tax=Cuscuta epithymum TaxID=186058 RepID=A0AAV0EQH9_9ASTE|nr:unnamed protein product [Cuscuta epithymum]
MIPVNDLEQRWLSPAVEEDVGGLVFGKSTWIEVDVGSGGGTGDQKMRRGEVLSKGEHKLAIHPLNRHLGAIELLGFGSFISY